MKSHNKVNGINVEFQVIIAKKNKANPNFT